MVLRFATGGARLLRSKFRRERLLVGSCACGATTAIATAVGPSRCTPPPESSLPVPSAPPASMSPSAPPSEAHATRRQPPFNPEILEQWVADYLRSNAGRALLESEVAKALQNGRQSANAARALKEEMQRTRTSEEATFRRQVKRIAEEEASTAALREAERLRAAVEAIVAGAVREEVRNQVPLAVREDALMKRILAEQLQRVKGEVHRAAEQELHEICNEDQYHRVNRAFLQALERRAENTLAQTERRAEEAMKSASRPAYIAQIMAGGAATAAALALFLTLKPTSRL